MNGFADGLLLDLSIILAAIAVGSFIKGVTGSGLPQIAIPVMAVFLGVERAVVIMAIPSIVTNTWLIWRFRSSLRLSRDLPLLVIAGTIGAVVGTYGLETLDPAILALVLAAMIIFYLVVLGTNIDLHIPASRSRVVSGPVGLVAGAMQGATGMSGPLLTTYLHAYRLPKPVYVVSLVTLFQVYAVVQAVTLARLGLYSGTRFAESLFALVPIMLIMPLGARYADRLSQKAFDRWILLLLAASASKLLWDGVTGLW